MRSVLYAAVVCALSVALTGNAQMRGGVHTSGGVRGRSASGPMVAGRSISIDGVRVATGRFVGPSVGVTVGTPGFKTFRRFPRDGFRNGFSCFGLNCFALDFFPNDGFVRFGFGRHRGFGSGFGFGSFPFGAAGGLGFGYAGYGYPYATFDSNGFEFDQQQQLQYEQQIRENQRLQADLQDDERRQLELQQQLADQRAADAASRNQQQTSAPQQQATAPATPERELAPTVLVFRDHHQVDVRNYAIAGNTLYEFAPHWTRKIPLSDLDISATVAANEERGIQFSVPGLSKVQSR